MAFNAEVTCKALDKRVAALEKTKADFEKQLRQIDYSALVKKLDDLEKKIGALEKKAEAMDKLLSITAASLNDPKKLLDAAAKEKIFLDEKTAQKLWKAEGDKISKEQEKFAKQLSEMTRIEARLTVLEAMVRR